MRGDIDPAADPVIAVAPVGAAAGPAGAAPLLQAECLSRRFAVAGRRGAQLHAVDDVSLHIGAGESVGLVGESGCGKSTLVRLLARLLDPTAGRIGFDGTDIGAVPAARFARHALRGAVQMVFQDPTDSLNPRFTARETIGEPLALLRGLKGAAVQQRVDEVAAQVGLPLELLARFPHQLSGGQKARVGIARALVVQPRLLILDEPTSALDVSVQAVVLQLLDRLRRELDLSYLFVSHDLNVVRLLTDRVVVMYLGKVVEHGPVAQVFGAPRHPYTQALVAAIPGRAQDGERVRLSGEVRSPIDPSPTVCRFHGRCRRGEARCTQEMPALREVAAGQFAACHFD
jgi:oligopeptide/dipeptide ABC transporter ATP-binding protein